MVCFPSIITQNPDVRSPQFVRVLVSLDCLITSPWPYSKKNLCPKTVCVFRRIYPISLAKENFFHQHPATLCVCKEYNRVSSEYVFHFFRLISADRQSTIFHSDRAVRRESFPIAKSDTDLITKWVNMQNLLQFP